MYTFLGLSLALVVSNLEINVQAQNSPCNQLILDRSFVTQCRPSICESLLEKDENGTRLGEWPEVGKVVQIVSSREGKRLKVIHHDALDRVTEYYEHSHPSPVLFIETGTKFQRILGFGTTLTDAACANIDSLPDEIRSKLINDTFSTDLGIGLNLLKLPIGSTKYSYTNYALDEPDKNSVELSAYDLNHRIPLIKDAQRAAGRYKNRIKILASSSSAPQEYKTNRRLIQGGSLRQDKFSDYANYLINYIAAYKEQDLDIWSLIISEQPDTIASIRDSSEKLNYNSMVMRPSDAIKLIKAINARRNRQINGPRFKLLILGDSRQSIPVWVDSVFKTQSIADSVAGVAYSCESDEFAPYDNLMYASKRYPKKYLLATQSSVNSDVRLGDWQYAENYATEIVRNLEFGSVGWIDFSLALDLTGGPNIDTKFNAQAPIMVDNKRDSYYRDPMFYAIGHLSRYVKPGSIRVRMYKLVAPFVYASQSVAFLTPDNYLVVFVMNNNIDRMQVTIVVDAKTRVETILETKSFNTFIFRQ